MLKACVHLLGQNQGSHNESRRKKDVGIAPISFNLRSQSKDFSVRIVHAGGREELYPHEVPASHLMEKYPGMRVARPEVFKNPHQSLLWPDEILLPGHKYLMIPTSTARKLKHRQIRKSRVTGNAEGKDEMSDVNITWEAGQDISDESVSSAKEFYTSKVRLSRDSKRPMRRGIKAKKPFVPPLPKTRILWGPGWEPSLTSVQEVSP
ncbi:uncharacterized protein LOC8273508 [Ricinus communis]|uniref:Uncharacterized protein n=1 Tax=Ricinus communis TaxID=3988 RepID=B9SPL1_RICCO|nr:uncharacterized protein LOC8273508 [Ricinus communis]EEF34487.1 conserved hypothetical protein [Ricinus communis]|eukprot:XP_002527930.1 uncharacterized protein LOC8273508 [Ricinus communis]